MSIADDRALYLRRAVPPQSDDFDGASYVYTRDSEFQHLEMPDVIVGPLGFLDPFCLMKWR